MKKVTVIVLGVGLSVGIFAFDQEIDFGTFASSSMTSYGNSYVKNNANPIGESLGYKYTIDKMSYLQGRLTYSGYNANVNYFNASNRYVSETQGNSQYTATIIYGYNIQKEALMPVPTYLEVGVGYGNWNLNAPNDIYSFPSQFNYSWFYVPVGINIMNTVGNTTYSLKGGAIAEVGGQLNYNSFIYFPTATSDGQNISANSMNIDTTIGYYVNFETGYQLTQNWIFKWNIYYVNTPLSTNNEIEGISGRTFGNLNNQNVGVACSLGYKF